MSEELRPYGTDSTDPPAEPLTREEQYLSAIAGVTSSSDIPPKPLTRVEKYLDKIVENGGGGGGGGTTNYNELSNRPQVENKTLEGNMSLSDLGAQAALDTNQMAAVNSGVTATDVEQIGTNKNNISSEQAKTTSMSEGGTNYITVNGIRVYVSSTAPTGARTGDLWIGG